MKFQLNRNKISKIKSMGIMISWTFLEIGFCSDTIYSGMLSARDIIEYAQEQLSFIEENQLILNLAIEDEKNKSEIAVLLHKLGMEEERCIHQEIEKWKMCFLFFNLCKKENYIDGICSLSEIWQLVGDDSEKAIFIQGVDNDFKPEEFYTEKNYSYLYSKSWEILYSLQQKCIEGQYEKNYHPISL